MAECTGTRRPADAGSSARRLDAGRAVGQEWGMKILKRLVLAAVVLAVLLAGGVILLLSQVDRVAKVAIEQGGTFATGTQTTVNDVSIGLFSGKFGLSGLSIANPEGFKSPAFMSLGSGGVDLSLASLSGSTIEVPRFALDTLVVNLERRDGKTNYGSILDSLKRLQGQSGGATQPPASGGEKRLIINDLELSNIVVMIDLAGGPQAVSDLTRVTIPIDRISLSNVGKTGGGVAGTGVTVSELSSIVISAVLSAATEKGGGLIPADLLGDLNGRLEGLGKNLLDMKVVADTQARVEELGKKVIDDVKKTVDETAKKAADKASEALKGLIPGKK
jgi:hypothetical protein